MRETHRGESTGKARLPRAFLARAAGVFLLSALLCALLIASVAQTRLNHERAAMEQVIMEKSLQLSEVISGLVYKTQALAALALQSDGDIQNFDKVAAALVDDAAILNVLVAPGGVVSAIYPPEQGDTMLGFDFFSNMAGNLEAQVAVEKGKLVVSGPFVGAQQREILSGRLPVWAEAPDGTRQFWGIVSVTLKYPEALRGTGLDTLESQGLAYEVWRINPDDGQRQVIAGSSEGFADNARYIERKISILNADWYFRLGPVRQWYQFAEIWLMIAAALLLCFFAAYIVENNARLKRMKHTLEQQESASRRAAQSAREASNMKSTFLATVSHEIRTPMNGIIGFSELAMEDTGLAPPTRGYLLNIGRSAKGLMRIIDNLLDISKIEAGKMELENIPFTVHKLFEECATMSAPKAEEKGLSLRIDAGPAARLWLRGDPTKLRQILLNLLSNAIKFTGVGSVEMACSTVQEREDSASLLFWVKDSGIGMTAEQIAKIGESFMQADASTTRKYGGTGLGLAISKNLVRLMGGSLAVDSAPGVGSRFSFSLSFAKSPAPPEELPEWDEPAKPPLRPLFRGQALVCEDTASNQELAREHLRRAGLAVTLAQNGREGVDCVRQCLEEGRSFDIILMDIQMPVMDGLAAAKAIAGMGCRTPIVAMTANVTAGDRKNYREAGMESCLAKPFSAQDVRACLLAHLPPVGWEKAPAPQHVDVARAGALHRDLGLRLTDGDEEWYQRLLLRFVDEHANAHEKIALALRRGDTKLAGRLAHSLKGVGNMIGAVRLSAAAARLEQAITGQEPDALEEQMALLAREIEAVLFEVQPQAAEKEGAHAHSHL